MPRDSGDALEGLQWALQDTISFSLQPSRKSRRSSRGEFFHITAWECSTARGWGGRASSQPNEGWFELEIRCLGPNDAIWGNLTLSPLSAETCALLYDQLDSVAHFGAELVCVFLADGGCAEWCNDFMKNRMAPMRAIMAVSDHVYCLDDSSDEESGGDSEDESSEEERDANSEAGEALATFKATPAVASIDEFMCEYWDWVIEQQVSGGHLTASDLAKTAHTEMPLPGVVCITVESQVWLARLCHLSCSE